MSITKQVLRLPRIDHIRLRRFSLFTANPDASIDTRIGVVCLVGANGVGKSSLLSAVNFALTGTVPDPNRQFVSMEEYYKYTREYSKQYFRGRIDPCDEADAEIELTFTIAHHTYLVTRNLFEPDDLRGLLVVDSSSQEVILDGASISRAERHREYVAQITRDIGVVSFEEFTFLQLFVFTFDEQRKTLFWNERIMDRVLYRIFGGMPDMAANADRIQRDLDSAESRARNRAWEATRLRKRINELVDVSGTGIDLQGQYDTIYNEHESLSKQYAEESDAVRELEAQRHDANLRLVTYSVEEAQLRKEYSNVLEMHLPSVRGLNNSPIIVTSLSECKCAICGAISDEALSALSSKSNDTVCPLCDSAIPAGGGGTPDLTPALAKIDIALSKTKENIEAILNTIGRIDSEIAQAVSSRNATRETLDLFERTNGDLLSSLRMQLSEAGPHAVLLDYRKRLDEINLEKDAARADAARLKRDLHNLRTDLQKTYRKVEREFVPIFEDYAHKFLGMQLSIQMDTAINRELQMVVNVRGTNRRLQHHLSESQRFFLDIALRMAIIQFVSDPASKGSIYIDTPEGSLDIAYEQRAGFMLAHFSRFDHRIIMTANLNSSQLLLSLAKHCTDSNMSLCRITDWTELSDVQLESEELFNAAYSSIINALNGGGS